MSSTHRSSSRQEEVRKAHWEAVATLRVGDDPTGEVRSTAAAGAVRTWGLCPRNATWRECEGIRATQRCPQHLRFPKTGGACGGVGGRGWGAGQAAEG